MNVDYILSFSLSIAGNFDRAISCLEHQITLAREQSDKLGEGDACCGLGGVYQQMGEYERAIEFHQKDLKTAQVGHKTPCYVIVGVVLLRYHDYDL